MKIADERLQVDGLNDRMIHYYKLDGGMLKFLKQAYKKQQVALGVRAYIYIYICK